MNANSIKAKERRERILIHLMEFDGWVDRVFFQYEFGVDYKTIYRDLKYLFDVDRLIVFDLERGLVARKNHLNHILTLRE